MSAAVALPACAAGAGRTASICARPVRRNCRATIAAARVAPCRWRRRPVCAVAACAVHRRGIRPGRRSVTRGRWIAWNRASSSAPIWRPDACSRSRGAPPSPDGIAAGDRAGAAASRAFAFSAVTTRRWNWRNPWRRRSAFHCCDDALQRTRATDAQSELSALARRRNVRGAFAAAFRRGDSGACRVAGRRVHHRRDPRPNAHAC